MKTTRKNMATLAAAFGVVATGYAATEAIVGLPSIFEDSLSSDSEAADPGYTMTNDTAYIYSADGWEAVCRKLTYTADFNPKCVVLTNDIACVTHFETELNVPFDGRGHALSNVPTCLFSKIGENGSVSNLKLVAANYPEDGEMELTISLTDGIHNGSITRENYGKISNCAVYAKCKAALRRAISLVENEQDYVAFGGVAGVNYGTIENVYSNCTIEFVNTDSDSDTASVCPTHVFIGGAVGCNETGGVVNNIFCDYIRPYNTQVLDPQGTSTLRTTHSSSISKTRPRPSHTPRLKTWPSTTTRPRTYPTYIAPSALWTARAT